MSAAQTVYPSADNAVIATDWTKSAGANYWSLVGAGDNDDTTYFSRDAFIAGTGNSALKFPSITDPGTDTGFVITVRCRNTTAGGVVNLSCDIYLGDPASGGTLIESVALTSVSTAYANKSKTLAASNIANISDWTNVYVLMNATAVASKTVRVTQVSLFVPASPSVPSGIPGNRAKQSWGTNSMTRRSLR